MKLASLEVIPYALPFRKPYITAAGRLDRREMVLLRLRSEEGSVGLGEAVPLSLRGGASLAQVVRELEALVEDEVLHRMAEEGEGGEVESIRGNPEISPPARCAALTALLDLGERQAVAGPPVPCNATLVAGEPGAVAEEALRWAEEGFSTFKLKLGTGDDVAQVRAVREALGPEARIRVDANAAWSLDAAMRILAELESMDIELAEQPVATVEEAAKLSAATSIPLAADESIETEEEAIHAKEAGAFRLTGIKLSKVGGLVAGMRIASVLPAYVSSALDGPVGIAAGGRLAQMLHRQGPPRQLQIAHGLATQRLFAATIASVECRVRDGMLHMPEGPGLGIEIDEEALRAHRI